MSEFDEIFKKESVFFVVGASRDENKFGQKVFKDLLGAGYGVVAINHHFESGEEYLGTPGYPDLLAATARVEDLFDEGRKQELIKNMVVVVVIPPDAGLGVVKQALEHGITKFWFQPGAESEEMIKTIGDANAIVIHGQCIMVQKPKKNTDATT
ncbi:CoA-binding protein [Candidatus Woesearchaeota archaeon]|nr:CoA-binding protein [Candidatus Woesearchaeota archaeon]